MTTKLYPVIYEWAGKNFCGYAPDIPGCAATAKTLTKIRLSLRSALEAHLEWLAKDGDVIPEPSKTTLVNMQESPQHPFPVGYYVVVEQLPIAMPENGKRKRTENRRISARQLTAA